MKFPKKGQLVCAECLNEIEEGDAFALRSDDEGSVEVLHGADEDCEVQGDE